MEKQASSFDLVHKRVRFGTAVFRFAYWLYMLVDLVINYIWGAREKLRF